MKILFVQLWYDLYGGAEMVNDTLACQFSKDNYNTEILCLWNSNKSEFINNKFYKKEFINKYPQKISYKKTLNYLFHLNLLKFFYNFNNILKYCYIIVKSKYKLKKKIKNLNSDIIIITNPELIKCVPKYLLSRTIIHMHSNFNAYTNNKVGNLVKKYSKKIFKVVWLTNSFNNLANKNKYYNNIYIPNPIKFKSNIISSYKNNQAIFIGRLSKEKRVDLLSEIYSKYSKLHPDWKLLIYGSGRTDNIIVNDNIKLMGVTSNSKECLLNSSYLCLTSSTEGFPMVILEAYECGLPVIAFDYGSATSEIIDDNVTGYIINNNDINDYITKLNVFNDKTKLKTMGANAKIKAKNYYPENICKIWYKLFRGEL